MREKNIKDFVESAQRYCEWVEGAPEDELHEVDNALRLIADLYGLALRLHLPNMDKVEVDEPPEEEMISFSKQHDHIYERFQSMPVGYYREADYPLALKPEKDESTVGDLRDDLRDIYLDIKRGLDLFDRGYIEAAVFDWKFNFESHWGRHAVGALKILHIWRSDNGGGFL